MRRLIRALRRGDDRGLTLVELIVAIGIFSVVVAVCMAGIVIMTRSTVRADVVAGSGDAARTAFQRMERQVRYAESINYPGAGPSGARYVEFRTSAAVSKSGVATCTQWRWVPSSGALQMRSWNDTSNPSLPAWTTLTSDVLPDADTSGRAYPFEVNAATATSPRQTLTLRMRVGNATVDAGVDSETTFVARNSSVKSVSNADANGDGQSDTKVCITGTGRE